MEYLSQHIESLIFTTQNPISFDDIKKCLEESFETEFKKEDLEEAIAQITNRYKAEEFAFEVVQINGGYQFLTKGAYHQSVGTYLRQSSKKRLSKAAVETLSIIAYKQPVAKSEMEKIRGVSCDYSVQKLLEKELIAIMGRSDGPGRPLLYGTSEKFMDYFGINSLADLPKPKDFREPDNSIGESAPIEVDLPSGNQDSATDEGLEVDGISNLEVNPNEEASDTPIEVNPEVEKINVDNDVVDEAPIETVLEPEAVDLPEADEEEMEEAVDEMDKLKMLSEQIEEENIVIDQEETPSEVVSIEHVPDVEVPEDDINAIDATEAPTTEVIIDNLEVDTPSDEEEIIDDNQNKAEEIVATFPIETETPTEIHLDDLVKAETTEEELTDKIESTSENLKLDSDVFFEEE